MTTDRQRAVNRRNAQMSTGPRTPAGKAAASHNARRHGLTAALETSTVLSWYRVLLEDETVVLAPFEQDPYRHAAADLARAEAHLQRVHATEEEWLLQPTVLSRDEEGLVETREHVVEALMHEVLEKGTFTIPGSERALLPLEMPRTKDDAYFEMLERFVRHPAAKVGWDRKGFGHMRRLDREIARIRAERQQAHDRMAPVFARYRAQAEARRLRALARWTDQVALRQATQDRAC